MKPDPILSHICIITLELSGCKRPTFQYNVRKGAETFNVSGPWKRLTTLSKSIVLIRYALSSLLCAFLSRTKYQGWLRAGVSLNQLQQPRDCQSFSTVKLYILIVQLEVKLKIILFITLRISITKSFQFNRAEFLSKFQGSGRNLRISALSATW